MPDKTRKRGLGPFFAALSALTIVSLAQLALPSGLRGQYFYGSQFSGPPALTAVDATFSGLQLSRRWRFRPPDAFSAQWTGFLFVNRSGLYTFTTTADDGASLFVDSQAVVREQGQGPGTRTGEIHLERGSHAVLFQYFQIGGPYRLEWTWQRDDGPAEAVPAWTLSLRARGAGAVLVVRSLGVLWWAGVLLCVAFGLRLVYAPWYWTARRAELDRGLLAASRHAGVRRALILLLVFAALTAVETWPLITNPAHLSRNDNADTMLNEWTIAWVAHQLPRRPGQLFNANIFHPDPDTLAYSEPLIVQGAVALPLIWIGASPVLAYNLVLLAGFVLTGWSMWLVVRRWTGDDVAGVVAGVLFAFNAHTLTRLPHLQAQHVEFLPLALLSFDALLGRPRWPAAGWLTLSFILLSLTSLHLLVMGAVVLTVAALVRPEDWLGSQAQRVGPMLALAAGASVAALLPMLVPYWRVHAGGLERSLDEVAYFSAQAHDYWTTPSRLHAWFGTSGRGATSLFPGVAALALAAIALLGGTRALRDRRVRMSIAFGLVGLILSFGPMVPGYSLLYTVFPPLQAVRAAARFGYLAIVAIAILAGYGVATVRERLRASPVLLGAASGAVMALVVGESLVAPIRYEAFSTVPAIYGARELQAARAVAELPFPSPDVISRNASYMLGSTRNFRPLLNGYSGFIPPSYFAHYAELAGFPDARSLRALKAFGVTHVLVHVDRLSPDAAAGLARTADLVLVESEGGLTLYRVAP